MALSTTSAVAKWVATRARAAVGRLIDGARRISRRSRRRRLHGPALEQPSVVVAVGLVAALAAIAVLDPLMRLHPGVRDGSPADLILSTLTNFGEGVEILIGAGVATLVLASIDPAGLARRLKAGLFEVATTAAFAFVAVAGSGLLSSLIKNLYGRARPGHVVGDGVFQLHSLAFHSKYAAFPSGHATTAGATAMVLALLFPRARAAILACGALVAATRPALGAHFPSDVLAGLTVGVAFTLGLAHFLARRGLVFRAAADGRLLPRPWARADGWFDLLAGLIGAPPRQGRRAARRDPAV